MKELTALNRVHALCKELDAQRVAYCHWKSTAALDRSATGDNDLDLLVVRPDVGRFTEILYRLGFKEAAVAPARQLPGVLHYYGYDEEADRFVHVHAHYQLIVGDDMTKNYRLPIERVFVDSSIQEGPFKVPSPEFEFIVLVIRMILKHRTWDAVLRLRGRLPASARRELGYLRARIDPVKVYQILEHHVPWLTKTLFGLCVASLLPGCRTWTRIRVGSELQSALKGHGRRPHILDVHLKQWRWCRRVLGWLVTRRSPRKRLASGGAVIALVGGDGAGKSTAVAEVHGWLSRNFDTITVHLGKPPESLVSFGIAVVLRTRRWFEARAARAGGPQPEGEVSAFPGYVWLLRRVGVARRRYRAYARARRFATNGGLVICDRYPIGELKLMDGPQCAGILPTARPSRLIGFLAGKEEEYYRRIMPPDLLVVLKVDPEIAVRRRPDEVPAWVRARNTEVWEFDWGATRARVIDASQSRSEVVSRLKSLIWASL
jgi:thymidylate kinase